jgi:hypothetical protein
MSDSPIPPDPDDGAPELRALRLALAQAWPAAGAAAAAASASGAKPDAIIVATVAAGVGAALAPLADHLVESALKGGKARARASLPGFTTGFVAGWLARPNASFTTEGSQTLFDAMRALLEAPDPATAPAIGRLMADYTERRPDAYFRSMAGILSWVTHDECRELADVLRWLVTETRQAEPWVHAIDHVKRADETWERVPMRFEVLRDDYVVGENVPAAPFAAPDRRATCAAPRAMRLLHLWRVHGFGWERPGGAIGIRAPSLVLDRALIEGLDRLLNA